MLLDPANTQVKNNISKWHKER